MKKALSVLFVILLFPLLSFEFEYGQDGEWEVIYTNIATDPSSDVPGYPGVKFGPGTGTTHFDRVFASMNGHWAITADTDLPSGEDEVLIVDGVVVAKEGDPAPWAPGENIGFIETKVGVNDSGDYVFATNTDGPTGSDEYIIRSMGGSESIVVREGDSASPPFGMGVTWGSTLESPVIDNSGNVGFASDLITGLPTTEDDALIFNNTILAQEGVTVPAGQIGSETFENFDVSDFWVTPDGLNWIVQGDLTGSTASDDVVVVNGNVVIQEGVIISGSGFPNPVDGSGIVGVHMDPAGNWYVRGNNDTSEKDWVVRNGVVVAETDGPIYPGASENWDDTDFSDCFFMHVGNSQGEYVIGGVTDNPSDANGVLVYYGNSGSPYVLARESDPIDLDGNGMFDDDAYFDTFGNDDLASAVLNDDGFIYLVATIKDGTDTRIGQGLFRMLCTVDTAPIPTMSEYGMIVLMLLMFIFAIRLIKQRSSESNLQLNLS